MKVELSIKDDRELRAHIKDLIRGEVVSIARGEIRSILAEVVGGIATGESQEKVDAIAKSVISTAVQKEFSRSGYAQVSFVQKTIREQISEMLRKAFQTKAAV